MSDITFKEKLKTLRFGTRQPEPKVRVDRNECATVTVTEHADGRVDVTACPDTIAFGRVRKDQT